MLDITVHNTGSDCKMYTIYTVQLH